MTVKFLPLNKVLLIMADNMIGQENDPDSQNLFRSMNVPEQHSDSGVGKSILLENKTVNLVCAQKKTGDYTCNLMLSKNDHTQMSPIKKMFQYRIDGPGASDAHKLFHNDSNDRFEFISTNSRFKITSSNDLFLIQYQE